MIASSKVLADMMRLDEHERVAAAERGRRLRDAGIQPRHPLRDRWHRWRDYRRELRTARRTSAAVADAMAGAPTASTRQELTVLVPRQRAAGDGATWRESLIEG